MKVTIVNVQAPFVRGGAEYLADSLAGRVRSRGHRVAAVNIPFKWYPLAAIPEHMLACRLLDVGAGDPDLVIAFKFPAYLAPFPRKRLWLVHQFRQAYELDGTPLGQFGDSPEERALRRKVQELDRIALGEASRLFATSRNVASRVEASTKDVRPSAIRAHSGP